MSYKETLLKHHPALVALGELKKERGDVYFSSSEIAKRSGMLRREVNLCFEDFKKIGIVKYRIYGGKNQWCLNTKKKTKDKRVITDNDKDAIIYLTRRGETDDYISRVTGISRQTVNKYKRTLCRKNLEQ